jgi:predicted transcriptional regulator
VSRTVVVRVGPAEQARRELSDALAAIGRGEPIVPAREIWFSSIEQLAATLTESRLELLRLIRRERPPSVKALARLARRSAGTVEKDLQALALAGLVKLVATGRVKRPVAGYDRIHLAADITIARAAA